MILFHNQADYQYEAKIPLSDILNMPFYKFEIFIKRMNERNEERAKQEKKMNDDFQKNQPSYKQPAFKPPKFKMPKLR